MYNPGFNCIKSRSMEQNIGTNTTCSPHTWKVSCNKDRHALYD